MIDCPTQMWLGLLMPLICIRTDTVVPYHAAIPESVWPGLTICQAVQAGGGCGGCGGTHPPPGMHSLWPPKIWFGLAMLFACMIAHADTP